MNTKNSYYENLQSRVFNRFLILLSIVLIPLLIISLSRIFTVGWLPLMGLHIVLVLVVGLTAIYRNKTPIWFNALVVIFFFLLIGFGAIFQHQDITYGFSFILISIMISMLFFQRKIIFNYVLFITVILYLSEYQLNGSVGLQANLVIISNVFLAFIVIATMHFMLNELATSLLRLEKQNIQLDKTTITANSANQAKSKFLSSMSHELRTPLNAILGFAQLISLDEEDDIKNQNLNEIINAGNHLLELINQVLDLSKIESGNVELNIKSYSFNKIFNAALVMIKPLASKHTVQLDNKVNIFPDFNIAVDELRFKQVLLNILSNAIKYNSENGKVIIDGSLKDENMFCLSVTDTGVGLTSEQLNSLFVPFDRLGAENSTIEGTGLGLVICKDLIELMKGSITVESEVGKGSRFLIQIPLS